jgi:hypothetical protein
MMTSETNPKAEEAYIQAHRQACDLLVHFEAQLHDLPAPEKDDMPFNWAHVGLASEVVTRLTSVVAFLSGTEN